MRSRPSLHALAAAFVLTACSDVPTAPFFRIFEDWVAQRSPVLVGAGDIAACDSPGDEATAALLDDIPGTVFTAGDNAYDHGSPLEYQNCYHPSWGRHRDRTRPALGNHEYHTPGAAGYYAYFGAAAGPPGRGYYSYDLGSWHIVVLDSNLPINPVQQAWLRQDLDSHDVDCTLAYWHHPRFSSGTTHGSEEDMEDIWQILYDADADVVISGHEHNYERFAPQSPQGAADPVRGIREFVVGTGGKSLYRFGQPVANSEVRYNADYGVLKLTLRPRGYSWEFINTARTIIDSGSGACH